MLQKGLEKVVKLILVDDELSEVKIFRLIIKGIMLGLVEAGWLMVRSVLFVFQVAKFHGTQFHGCFAINNDKRIFSAKLKSFKQTN